MQTMLDREKSTGRPGSPLSPLAASWLCLACAAPLLLIADGRDTAALAIWPAQTLLLRFLRTQPMARGLLVVYLVRVALLPIAFRGMIPIPAPFYSIYLAIAGLSGLIPYLFDRWLAPRFKGFANTLVFPAALTVSQYIYGKGPMGSWGSIAYSQTGSLALTQLLAVTGLSGIVFLTGWFASASNWAWQARAPRRLVALAAVIGTVLLAGELRLAFAPPAAPAVRVASLSLSRTLPQPSDELVHKIAFDRPSVEETASFRASAAAINDDLLARTEREARAGARILFWAEGNAQLLKQDEPRLLTRGQALARQYRVYLGMAFYTWTPGLPRPLENKVILIAPDGAVAWQYWKSRPTPGPEMAAAVVADGRLRTLDTPYGRLATPICYDMDFPALLRQAGQDRVDVVLSPANDWRAIDPRHTEIAAFRAVEQGFNLVRQSSGGLSAAYDYQGRPLAVADSYRGGDGTLVVELPTRGVRTVYSVLGDWLPWVCAAALIALLAVGVRRRSEAQRAA